MLGVVRRLRSTTVALAMLVATGCSSSGSSAGEPMASDAPIDAAATSVSPTGTPTPEPTPLGTIAFSERGCRVDEVEDPIAEGPVSLTIANETDAVVVANMSKILEGGTYKELEAHIAKEIRLAEAGKPGLGHPSFAPPSFDLLVEPGETDVLVGDVTAGTYAIVCGRTYDEVGEVRPSGVSGPYRVE
jgi:hypothetical protein